MSTNWKAGDKALCVEKFLGVGMSSQRPDHNKSPNGLPVVGTIYLVVGTTHFTELGLQLAGLPVFNAKTGRPSGWVAYKFRKIVPACDRATNQEEGLVPHEGFWEGRK